MWYHDRRGSRRPSCKLALVFLAPLLLGAWPGCSPKPAANDDEALMKAGLEALQTRHDPETAIADFRKVLEHTPDHYGATFQLAAALEAAGRRDEARPLWEKMVAMAERQQDTETAASARAHLAGDAAGASEAVTMQAGLDALYQRHDPAEAIAQFRKVLEHNPTHYGATFQLATALDMAGKRAEARPLWEKMLQMAEASKDIETADKARARLHSTP